MDVSVVNTSRSQIERVTASIKEATRWKARRHWKSQDVEMASKNFGWLDDSVMNPPQESAKQPKVGPHLEHEMRRELDQATHRQILTIPNNCHADFSSKLTSVKHFLLIEVISKNRFGPSNITVPLIVHARTELSTPAASAVGWQAEALPSPVVSTLPMVEASPEIVEGTPIAEASGVGEMIHPDIECDGCQQYPLRGVRYRCAHLNHDYCHNCYASYNGRCVVDKTTLAVHHQAQVTVSPYVPTIDAASNISTENQGFHPIIEHQVGSAAIWEDNPCPQATGLGAWVGKTALRTMGVNPDASIPRQVPQVLFTPVPFTPPEHVSLQVLRTQLAVHPDPVSAISQHLQQPSTGYIWRNLLSRMSPADFGDMVGSVPQDFRQSPVAEKMVPLVHNFSLDHLLAAIKQARSDGARKRMLSTLSGYIVDLKKNRRKVRAELSDIDDAFFRAGLRYGRRCG